MLLKNLIKSPPQDLKKLNIKGLAINSKKVRKGFIFFAIKGKKSDGENFIRQAIKKGAILVVASKKCKIKSNKVNILKINDVRAYLGEVVSKFYKRKPNNIIAVTGTNGKTSVAEFFYQILDQNKIPVGSIGTLGIKYKKKFIKTNLTSPDIITLHENLERLKKNKIDNVILEASSHGIDQKRLNNLKFKVGVFTNFSQDHLDYHKNMKSYLNAKLKLFSRLLPKKSYVVTDSSLKEYSKLKKITIKRKLRLLDVKNEFDKIKKIPTNLIGAFQIKNLSVAVVLAKICRLKTDKIYSVLKKINNVPGRLQLIKRFPNNIRVFIDYAHTPDALQEALKSIKNQFRDNISLVFGCGGERDFKKRPLMANVAKSFCKKIYVTDDNPRNESPKKIRKEIIQYLKGSDYFDIPNRIKAIKKAVINAEPNEIILVAGKGHESFQDYGKKILFISDKKIINNIKVRKKIITKKKQTFLFNSKIINKIIKNKKFYKSDGLAMDSREIKKNNLFLAIKGKNNDGNQFIPKAINKGASYIVSSKKNIKQKKKLIKFKNPLNFLNDFANLKRKYSNAKIIGITGSAGKTTLKDVLFTLLENYKDTYASPKSYNNHYGVPLSLSNLKPYHQLGVFELGMSKMGEINKLSKMVKPDIAIITNVAEAHIENFRNIKGIAKAKGEIIDNVQQNGTVILNHDDKFFNYFNKKAKSKKLNVVSFGKSKKSDIRLIKITKNRKMNKIIINAKGEFLKLTVKDVNIYAVLASITVLQELNLNLHKTAQSFKSFQPSDGRGKIHKIRRYKKTFNLIDESYNANPFTVKNALNSYSKLKKNKSKKYLLLGDMLELGKRSEAYHRELSGLINKSDIDKVFIKGKKMLFAYKNLEKSKRGNICQSNQDVDLILKNIITNGDYLMIKGSNATGLNVISKAMIRGV